MKLIVQCVLKKLENERYHCFFLIQTSYFVPYINYAKSSGMNVNKTTPTHSTKQMIINVLFLAYGANDNSIAGLVPHLKLHRKE